MGALIFCGSPVFASENSPASIVSSVTETVTAIPRLRTLIPDAPHQSEDASGHVEAAAVDGMCNQYWTIAKQAEVAARLGNTAGIDVQARWIPLSSARQGLRGE
jgi:hypothetical protein